MIPSPAPHTASAPHASERAPRHSATLPWLVPAVWGAGLVLAGLGAAAIMASPSTPFARGIGYLTVTLGLAALVWGAAVLRAGHTVAPRLALGCTLTAVASVAALVAATGGRASLIGAAIATALLVVTGVVIAVGQRCAETSPSTLRMVPFLVAASLVALVVTPALGAVQDAALMTDDGTVIVVDPHEGH